MHNCSAIRAGAVTLVAVENVLYKHLLCGQGVANDISVQRCVSCPLHVQG